MENCREFLGNDVSSLGLSGEHGAFLFSTGMEYFFSGQVVGHPCDKGQVLLEVLDGGDDLGGLVRNRYICRWGSLSTGPAACLPPSSAKD